MESLSINRGVPSHYDKITGKDYLRVYCRVSYQPRRVKNKGAIVVLVWSFLVCNTGFYTLKKILKSQEYKNLTIYITLACIGITLPIAGWLADIRFGRYKVMCWSIWTMWLTSMLLTTSCVVIMLVGSYDENLPHILTLVFTVLNAIGMGGFQANVIQFGVDQLTDASTTEITSFIAWYTWCILSSRLLALLFTCVSKEYTLIGQLFVCTSLSLVVSSNHLFNNYLIKEPVTQNPFRLIYQVVKYAIRNKYLRRRSALEYYEDDLPSRIDFGKRKYGGPFTTEQIEDVKTFFKIIGLISLVSAATAVLLDLELIQFEMYVIKGFSTLFRTGKSESYTHCLRTNLLCISSFLSGTIAILLHEILIYPILNKCMKVKSHWKVFWGIVFQLGAYIIFISMLTSAKKMSFETTRLHNDTSIDCLFHASAGSLANIIEYKWFIIPEVLVGVSQTWLTIGTIEFYCAQVPYSMKGLLVGCFYGYLGLFVLINYGISLIFKKNWHIWQMRTIFGCGFWYLQAKIILLVVIMLLILLAIKYYKSRKREDVLPNEHIFAEEYYSRSD